MKKILSTMALFAALSWAADVTGTWSGPMSMTRNGETRDDSAHLVLTQSGNTVTGTVGPSADKQMPILKGTIEGSDVTLEAAPPGDGKGKLVLTLKVDGDKLTGDLKAENGDGEVFSGKMNLSKQK